MKNFLLALAFVAGAVVGFVALECVRVHKNATTSSAVTAETMLVSEARTHGYTWSDNAVAVPYTSLPAEKLAKWKAFSQERMNISTDGGINKVCVVFTESGTEIVGTDIMWRGSDATASFPYRLGKEETLRFVKTAISDMEMEIKK